MTYPEPEEVFEAEYELKASLSLMNDYLTDADMISDWFVEKAIRRGTQFTLHWDGEDYKAKLIDNDDDDMVRYDIFYNEEEMRFIEFVVDYNSFTETVFFTIRDGFNLEEDEEDLEAIWDQAIAALQDKIGR
jgi:hypothetical protein